MADGVRDGSGRVRFRRPAATLGLRWVHLLQGGALFTPFFLLVMVGISVADPNVQPFGRTMLWQFAGLGLALPLVAVAGLLPVVRPLEAAAARTLCRVPANSLAAGPADSWAARRRTAVWFALHAGMGAVISGASLAVPPAAVVLILLPFSSGLRSVEWSWPWDHAGTALWTAPLTGLALLAALVTVVHGAGTLLARTAPLLLGPTPADRLAAAERRAADLAARNRVARELHDSVGHALSAVSLQAGAARRVLDTDPTFAHEALAAIEETARNAVAELDSVLGALRTDPDTEPARPRTPANPTLAEGLDALLARCRATGTEVESHTGEALGPLHLLPAPVSRGAFRILQEGLSNALRHAAGAPVQVRLDLHRGPYGAELLLGVHNSLRGSDSDRGSDSGAEFGPGAGHPGLGSGSRSGDDGAARASGGRGLTGVAERAVLLGGTAEAGPEDGVWHLTARLPLAAGTEEEHG